MRRLTPTSLVVACVALAAPATTLASSAIAAKQPKRADARAALVTCHSALDQLSRSLTVDSTMRSLSAGDRMQMRFELYQRTALAPRARRLAGPGLGTWNAATPGVDRFRYRKPIQNLPAPATYFVKVSYRWLDGGGAVTARTTRYTGTCFQPDRRPDLRILSLATPRRVGPGEFAYRVLLRNAGRTASRDFDVVLTVGGVPRPARTLAGMLPGERRAIDLIGPRCDTGVLARVEVDPDNRVDEANETNNSRSISCP